jgi:sugar phosphate isomerase/epimerase
MPLIAPVSAKRAFSSLGCPGLNLDDTFALARRHGLAGVEFRALEGTVELPALFAKNFGTPGALAAHLRDESLRIFGLGTSVRLFEARDGDREALLAYVPWAEAASVPYLRIFDGGTDGTEAEFANAASLFRWWDEARAAGGWSVDLIVETHDAIALPATLARYVGAFPNRHLLWDAHHTWRKGGTDPVVTWPLVAPVTRHIHVKDSVSRPGPRLPYTYVIPGDGEFPMAPLLAALGASGYAGVLSLEWERMWHPELPPLDDALTGAANGWW